ncbi:unnamed protein product [Sphagnum balticum]
MASGEEIDEYRVCRIETGRRCGQDGSIGAASIVAAGGRATKPSQSTNADVDRELHNGVAAKQRNNVRKLLANLDVSPSTASAVVTHGVLAEIACYRRFRLFKRTRRRQHVIHIECRSCAGHCARVRS